ncbi:MAG TPA: UDP-forming cellulose synthase catalytic subunit [Roseococcus sp.]|nr:UDP-forming cellulose synthase catalytic subunit [Roseococcus sp.]
MSATPSRRSEWLARLPLARTKLFGTLMALFGGLFALLVIVVPMEAEQQAVFGLLGFLVFLIFNRLPGRTVTIMLAVLSALVSLRYLHWRVTETLDFTGFWQTFLGTGLVLAELYALVVLVLSYIQLLWPLERKPAPMPEDPDEWPVVDVFIPTYNEALEVVRPTVFAALAMDWPADKLRVHLLDDGRREEFRRFAAEAGCNYIIRPDNKGAKAGNINHAMAQTDGEYIVVFDCDHVATRAFLQLTMGWMLRDKGLAMVQTPHHFYSPDPFERNLVVGRKVPNEGLLFYGLIQQGNDFWGAAFFCGSCAVIRRAALEAIGGVPTETVTEDCHASLKMQKAGWRTAYIRVPLAAGLATERLVLHIGQRMRWARGMIQILRIENPLFARGLNLPQRICYFLSTIHYLFPLPRFVFLTAPLAFLIFQENVIAASPLAIVAYAGPHIIHSIVTASRMQTTTRHSFWSEIYETVLTVYLLPVMLATLFDPKRGKFNVTDKGGTLEEGYFDIRAVGPSMILALALITGLMLGVYGLSTNPPASLEFQAYALNVFWAVLCLISVLAGIAVGRERRQLRERARVRATVLASAILPDGRRVEGVTEDLSLGGAALRLERPDGVEDDALVTIEVDTGMDRTRVPAEVLRWQEGRLQVRFAPQDMRDEGAIVRIVLGRADAWVDWDDVPADRPLRSLRDVVFTIGGLFAGESQFSRPRAAAAKPARAPAPPAAPLLEEEDEEQEAPPPRRRFFWRRAAAAATVALALLVPGLALAQGAPPPLAPLPPPPGAARPQAAPLPAPSLAPPPAPALAPPAAPITPAPITLVPRSDAPRPAPAAPAAQPFALPPLAPLAPADAPPAAQPFGLPGLFGAAPATGIRQETRTLSQLGLAGPMQLRGVSDLQGVLFGVRGDEVVTQAMLLLEGATSPALIPELSQIAITMNEQFVGAVQPERARPAFGPLEFPINPAFFSDANRLNFRFSGRYAIECNDPVSGLLWASISNNSTLTLTLERLPTVRDLARLPEPFFDPRLLREPLVLPIIMPGSPSDDMIRAGAIVSSWFAIQADYRGATFPVASEIPLQGNAVVFLAGLDSVPGLAIPRLDGPTLAVVDNPNDPLGLLLVVAGRTGIEMVAAATALGAGREALTGELALVSAQDIPARLPYDAPRWVRTDRPVRFGELMDPSELQAFGYVPGPIAVPFRTAPDLYTWRGRPLQADIRFRAPPGPILDVAVSRMDVAINDVFLRSVPLAGSDPGWPLSWVREQFFSTDRGQANVGMPTYLMFGQNELQLRFDMRPLHRGDCVAVPGDIRAAVDPDSTLDLTRAHRFATLPNLAHFVSSGFPFTRLADFAQTAAVIPERPTAAELESLFTLMGKLSAIVGYPPIGMQVARPDALQAVAERDLLVFGELSRQPALARLLADGPIQMEGNRLTVRVNDGLPAFRHIFGGERQELMERVSAQLANPGEALGALIGFQSPLRAGRSVVALTGSSQEGVEAMIVALRDREQLPRVQGDLALLSGGRVDAFRIGPTYTVGLLPPWLWPEFYLGNNPWTLVLMTTLALVLLAAPLYWVLRRRAARRLRERSL